MTPLRRMTPDCPRSLVPLLAGLTALTLLALAGPAIAQQARFGTVTLSPGAPPQVLGGTAGGGNDASLYGSSATGPCRGWIEVAPNHQMILHSAVEQLEIRVSSSGDTTLVVQGPGGTLCNDDTDGLNPVIAGRFEPGIYNVYVGTYSPAASDNYSITFSGGSAGSGGSGGSGPAAGLDLSTSQVRFGSLTLGSGFAPDPQRLHGALTTQVQADALGDSPFGPCRGWTTPEPSHLLTLTSSFERLAMSVESTQDTTLIVHGPDGWRCNDDTYGLQPEIAGAWSAGTYRVWVGVYQNGASGDYELRITAASGGSGSSGGGGGSGSSGSGGGGTLDVASNTPRFGQLTLATGFLPDPQYLSGNMGGSVDVTYLGNTPSGPCVGVADRAPNHLLTLTTGIHYLRVDVQSSFDPTLVIQGPDGWRCNDDSEDLNPSIDGAFPLGTYRVWVGSYGSDEVGMPYTLLVSELPPSGPAPEPSEYQFQGRFEDTDVFFSGMSPEDVFDECMVYASGASLSLVDDVTIFGAAHHNGPAFWSGEQLCAMAALNARTEPPVGGPSISGRIEDFPFRIEGDVETIRSTLRRFVPVAVSGALIDDVQIEGTNHHNGPGFWSPDAVATMIAFNIADPTAALTARGDIEGAPFVFSGANATDIREQCLQFVEQVGASMVDDVTVNGEHRHNTPSFWNASEICMMVSSLAR